MPNKQIKRIICPFRVEVNVEFSTSSVSLRNIKIFLDIVIFKCEDNDCPTLEPCYLFYKVEVL